VDAPARFSVAPPRKLCAEFSLTALACNLRRALNILGVEALTAAIAAYVFGLTVRWCILSNDRRMR
jgi:hypothetical protein